MRTAAVALLVLTLLAAPALAFYLLLRFGPQPYRWTFPPRDLVITMFPGQGFPGAQVKALGDAVTVTYRDASTIEVLVHDDPAAIAADVAKWEEAVRGRATVERKLGGLLHYGEAGPPEVFGLLLATDRAAIHVRAWSAATRDFRLSQIPGLVVQRHKNLALRIAEEPRRAAGIAAGWYALLLASFLLVRRARGLRRRAAGRD